MMPPTADELHSMNLTELGKCLKLWEEKLRKSETPHGRKIGKWVIERITKEIIFKDMLLDALMWKMGMEDVETTRNIEDLGVKITENQGRGDN